MKKVFKLTTGIVLAVVLVLAGCNGVKADEYGWYHDYASAKAVAQK
jgi:hypothetical protein